DGDALDAHHLRHGEAAWPLEASNLSRREVEKDVGSRVVDGLLPGYHLSFRCLPGRCAVHAIEPEKGLERDSVLKLLLNLANCGTEGIQQVRSRIGRFIQEDLPVKHH